MRRFAVVSSSLLAALALASAANAESAHFVLRIDAHDSNGLTTVVGRGTTESSQGRSKLDLVLSNGSNEVRYKAILSASTKLTLFLSGKNVLNLSTGATWARTVGAGVAPLMDPSLPLRLARGRALGGGRYQVRIAGPDAVLLAPAATRAQLRGGFAGTIWLDRAGHVSRFKATVPFAAEHTTIDERFSGFGQAGLIALPPPRTVSDPDREVVNRFVEAAVVSIESWYVDHPATGYAGATAARLKRRYSPDGVPMPFKVIRATRDDYCIEATLNGVTARKDGPASKLTAGHCPR